MKNAADILQEKINEKQNPSCVGLDPRIRQIPDFICYEALQKHENLRAATAEALFLFNRGILEAVRDIVPAVKPQMAFYEQFGAEGVDAFERTCAYARELGFFVIGDSKRNDIGSTAQAYANGHLGEIEVICKQDGKLTYLKTPSLNVDMLTINAYLGSDGVKPFTTACEDYGKGVFVLAKTSNKSSGELQDLLLESGEEVYKKMASLIHTWGEPLVGEYGISSVGAVVGATYPEEAEISRAIMPHTFFLVPGYGAQGGGGEGVVPNFTSKGIGAIVNSSRGIIHHPYVKGEFSPSQYQEGAKAAAIAMRDDIVGALKSAGKLPQGW